MTNYFSCIFCVIILLLCNSCIQLKYYGDEKKSAICQSCRVIDKASDSVTYLEIEFNQDCLLPSSLFERYELSTLIILNPQLDFSSDMNVENSNLDTLAIYDPKLNYLPGFISELDGLKALVLFFDGVEPARELAESSTGESLMSLNLGLTRTDSIPAEVLSMPNLSILRIFTEQERLMHIDSRFNLSQELQTLRLPIDGSRIFEQLTKLPNLERLQLKSLVDIDALLPDFLNFKALKEVCIQDMTYIHRLKLKEILPDIEFKCTQTFLYPEGWRL